MSKLNYRKLFIDTYKSEFKRFVIRIKRDEFIKTLTTKELEVFKILRILKFGLSEFCKRNSLKEFEITIDNFKNHIELLELIRTHIQILYQCDDDKSTELQRVKEASKLKLINYLNNYSGYVTPILLTFF